MANSKQRMSVEEYVQKLVAEAPPFTPEQRAKLSQLLTPPQKAGRPAKADPVSGALDEVLRRG